MYNPNIDGYMFNTMKGYHHEQFTRKARQAGFSRKFITVVGRILMSAEHKLAGMNDVMAPASQSKTWSAS